MGAFLMPRSPLLSVGVSSFLVVILVGTFSILVAQLTQSYLELYASMVGERGRKGEAWKGDSELWMIYIGC